MASDGFSASLCFEPLALAHVDACAAIAATAPDPWSREVFQRLAGDARHHTLVALAGSEVVGFCSFLVVEDTADLQLLAVAERARRRGCAAALLRQCLPQLATRGVARALLEARQSNTAAIALYKKLGFKTLAPRPGMYQNPREDGILMGMELTTPAE